VRDPKNIHAKGQRRVGYKKAGSDGGCLKPARCCNGSQGEKQQSDATIGGRDGTKKHPTDNTSDDGRARWGTGRGEIDWGGSADMAIRGAPL
jgi:hypothetical protein